MNIYQRMEELNIQLPSPPPKGGVYAPVRHFAGCLVYVSGCGPVLDTSVTGRLGENMTVEEGQLHARNCVLNILAALQADLGDLRRVKGVVKLLTMVQSTPDFHDQPAVANGGSQLLVDLFGPQEGLASRSAIGVCALPGNIPVETEAIFELAED